PPPPARERRDEHGGSREQEGCRTGGEGGEAEEDRDRRGGRLPRAPRLAGAEDAQAAPCQGATATRVAVRRCAGARSAPRGRATRGAGVGAPEHGYGHGDG